MFPHLSKLIKDSFSLFKNIIRSLIIKLRDDLSKQFKNFLHQKLNSIRYPFSFLFDILNYLILNNEKEQ